MNLLALLYKGTKKQQTVGLSAVLNFSGIIFGADFTLFYFLTPEPLSQGVELFLSGNSLLLHRLDFCQPPESPG